MKRIYPHVNFKRDFPVVPNMSDEKVKLADTYFKHGQTIVGPTKKGKYKSRPIATMGISTVAQRLVSVPAVALRE